MSLVTISVDKVLHDLYWEPVKKGDEFGPYLRTISSHVFTNSVLRIYDFFHASLFVYFSTSKGFLLIEYQTVETNAIVTVYVNKKDTLKENFVKKIVDL